MKSQRTDEIILIKIKKYSSHLKNVYEKIRFLTEDELEDSLYAYSAAQLITNLKESYDMFTSEEMQERYKLLRQPSIVRIRNIASHDYEALNWSIVKTGCKRITEAYDNNYHAASLEILNAEPSNDIEAELERDFGE